MIDKDTIIEKLTTRLQGTCTGNGQSTQGLINHIKSLYTGITDKSVLEALDTMAQHNEATCEAEDNTHYWSLP
jgi:hypothetical protein